ncbi:MAG: hypothetical protein PHV74_06690 [Dehalococcoidia bacterium]|nr:hypothetical protein [Dehalococcoidia bacterium]
METKKYIPLSFEERAVYGHCRTCGAAPRQKCDPDALAKYWGGVHLTRWVESPTYKIVVNER